jgi:hypothetical protein
MAKSKGPLDSIKSGMSGLASRIPFVNRSIAPSPEPFSTIEDDTPLSDIVLSDNAAPAGASAGKGGAKPDLRGFLASVLGRKPVLIGLIGVLGFVLVIVAVSIAVTIPPKAPEAAKPITKEGTALVKTWLLPPGDPLEPRVEMQRGEVPAYTAEDAARLGLLRDRETIDKLAAKNDRAMRELYGTAP